MPPTPPTSRTKAILTDGQFLVPAIVLCLGIALLIALH
jgi:hypothetical protein